MTDLFCLSPTPVSCTGGDKLLLCVVGTIVLLTVSFAASLDANSLFFVRLCDVQSARHLTALRYQPAHTAYTPPAAKVCMGSISSTFLALRVCSASARTAAVGAYHHHSRSSAGDSSTASTATMTNSSVSSSGTINAGFCGSSVGSAVMEEEGEEECGEEEGIREAAGGGQGAAPSVARVVSSDMCVYVWKPGSYSVCLSCEISWSFVSRG